MRFFLFASQFVFLSLFGTIANVANAQANSSNAPTPATTAEWATTTKNVSSSDGTYIYAEGTGNFNKPHVLFAPGLACTIISFDSLFNDQNLLNNLYMVRFDTRGQGRSGKPPTADGFVSSLYADDLSALITAFKLDKPFFAGWSLGAAIGADIAANFPHPLPFQGLIWLSGLPYIGAILPIVATPVVLSFLPGLESDNDTTLALQTRINFVSTLSANTAAVPFDTLAAWTGNSVYLDPTQASLELGRSQNATGLLDAGAEGWPLLILHGTADAQINGSAVISNMAPLFKNVEYHLLEGAGHISFYDAEAQSASYLLTWINKVKGTYVKP